MAIQLEYIMAIDYGEKRVGIAIAHQIARLPRPLLTLTNDDNLQQQIAQLLQREQVGLVVVGLPRNMEGGYSAQTHAAEAFAERLRATVEVPVELSDETLTSVDAHAQLAGKTYAKGDVDALAASFILERYLAEHPPGEETAHV